MPDETTVSTTAEDTSTTISDASVAATDAGTTTVDGGQSAGAATSRRRGARGVGARNPSKSHASLKGSGSGLSGGPEKTEVNTDKLRATADKGKQTIKTLKETLASVAESVRATEGNTIWMGAAADDYREHFLHVLDVFNKQLDQFAAYPRDHIAYADEQDKVITENNRLAQSVLEEVEAANWPTDL